MSELLNDTVKQLELIGISILYDIGGVKGVIIEGEPKL
jgi:hypothetical protein